MPSVAQEYRDGCRTGQLLYQWDEVSQKAVFYPRVIAPATGGALTWRISTGVGTVYSTTFVHRRGEDPRNLSLIDLDEGFRMMSRVEGVGPNDLAIGDRVRVHFADDGTPLFTKDTV